MNRALGGKIAGRKTQAKLAQVGYLRRTKWAMYPAKSAIRATLGEMDH
jgi:hypothetical protein